MATYQEELKNFQERWNLPKYDLYKLADNVQQLRFAEETFLKGSPVDNTPSGQYVKWFSRTIALYFERNTQPNVEGKYIDAFNAQEFYDSFARLVQAKYDADAQEKGETPPQVHDVALPKEKEIKAIIAYNKRLYKKTLPELWKENLKQGHLKMDTLQSIADQAYSEMMVYYDADKSKMDGELTTMVAACEAMKQLRESRSGIWGWFWKVIFRREQNRQEKALLFELETKVETLRARKYDVDAKKTEVTLNAAVISKAKTVEKPQEIQPENVKNVQEGPVESTAKTSKVESVTAQLEGVVSNWDVHGEFAKEVNEKIPEHESLRSSRYYTFKQQLSGEVGRKIKEMNQRFDAGLQSGKKPEELMGQLVRDAFKATERANAGVFHFGGNEGTIEGFKIYAKALLQKFTAVALYPEQLGGLVDGYLEQNAKFYKEVIKQEKDYVEEIAKYEADLAQGLITEEIPPEKVFNDGAIFEDNKAQMSPQIANVSKQNELTLNSNK